MFSEQLPGWAVLGITALLLGALVVWETTKPGQIPAVPAYFLIPIGLMAWFSGWRIAVAAVLTAVAGTALLVWQGGWSSYTPLFYVGRLATFLTAALLSRGLSTGRLILDFYYRGAAWRSVQRPRRVSDRFVVVPVIDGPDDGGYAGGHSDDIPIYIQPGLAFGTASHPTTQMCLSLLEDSVRSGMSILDVGCGTGILTIAAAKLGAAHILALDIDPEAGRVAQINITLNEISSVAEFRLGSLEAVLGTGRRQNSAPGPSADIQDVSAGYDLIVANIFAHVILELIEGGLLTLVKPEGLLIFSGVRESELDRFRKALQSRSLVIESERVEGEWAAMRARTAR